MGTKSRASAVRIALDAPSAPTIRSAHPSSSSDGAGVEKRTFAPSPIARSWRMCSNSRRPIAENP